LRNRLNIKLMMPHLSLNWVKLYHLIENRWIFFEGTNEAFMMTLADFDQFSFEKSFSLLGNLSINLNRHINKEITSISPEMIIKFRNYC
jgi:hypothetical protein